MFFWNSKKNKEPNAKNGKTSFLGFGEKNISDDASNKFLAIVNNLKDGILVFDEKNQLSFINPEAERIFRVKAKNVVGQSFIRLSDFTNFSSLISFLGGGIKETSRKELKLEENLILEITSLPLIIGDKKIGNLVILYDITQQKLMERMKTEFVMLAAHQLRTPTSGIKWSLRMLLDGDLGKVVEKQKEVVEKAYKTNEKVISIINDLLNIAKIEEGKFLFDMTLGNVEELINSTVGSYKKEIKDKKIKIEFLKTKEELPNVLMDANKIKMVIENIIDNAIRYNVAAGKIIISVQMAGLTEKGEKEIMVSIKDTGIGIPEERKGEVFNKFFRADNALKVETEGSGLGLFIAKNIIDAHGGRIWFESTEGKGTTIYFTIPIKKSLSENLSKELY